MNRVRLWPLGRDDHSGVLIGAGGTRPSDWPAIDSPREKSDRLHACRDKWQLAATLVSELYRTYAIDG